MSKMRKEYDPNKAKRRKRKPSFISFVKGKRQRRFILSTSVHGIVWWTLYQFRRNTRQLNIW